MDDEASSAVATGSRWQGIVPRDRVEGIEELAAVFLAELRTVAKGLGLMSPQRLQKCERLTWLTDQLVSSDEPKQSSPVGRFSAAVKQATADWPDSERELVLMTLGIEGTSGQTLEARRTAYAARWPGCDKTVYRAQVVVYEQLAIALALQWATAGDQPAGLVRSDELFSLAWDEQFLTELTEIELQFVRSAGRMIQAARPLVDLIDKYQSLPDGAIADLDEHPREVV